MVLQLKAKNFKDTQFRDCSLCPIATAAKELFNASHVNEGIECVAVWFSDSNRVAYRHEPYNEVKYLKDKELARSHNFDDTVIREIELIEF